uniref:DUF4374 domain-containing protein n=2 Tax=unclassified Prevotella TaxID=2638335 RepID=A0AB33IZA2_9BACT
MKKIFQNIFAWLLVSSLCALSVGCDDEQMGDAEIANAPYVLSLGITSGRSTTYYVVSAEDLMSGTINAVGKGIEQNGYQDYQQGGQTFFSIGGLGVTSIKGIQRGADGFLKENGEYVFGSTPAEFTKIDDQTMLAMELSKADDPTGTIMFYTIDIKTLAVKSIVKDIPVGKLREHETPYVTGMQKSGNKVYVTYLPMNNKTYMTDFTDKTLVAVFNYPSMTLDKILEDDRFGIGGSWNAFNGLMKDEKGDIYVMSNSSLSNGFSQNTKHSGFVRIPAATTAFDTDYAFDFEQMTGGRKVAHVQYVGNGLVFAEVSTIVPQTAADRWGDKKLACYVIDLYGKTAKEVTDIPVHNGNGGRRFAVLVEGNYVYSPIATDEGIYIYRTDMSTGKAVRGAKVSTTFVAGMGKL